MSAKNESPSILIIGASRGLGHAMAGGFLAQGWRVTGTVRGDGHTPLHDLAGASNGTLTVERIDITRAADIATLRDRLEGNRFDVLFVNAGTTNENPGETIAEVSTDEFVQVMVTNALSPMRVVEGLEDLVVDDGLIGVMSSGQGSIANNERGGREVYRGSKAALNQFMRSYAARQAHTKRALLLLAPGWIRTDLGGDEAPYTVEESIPLILDVIQRKRSRPGLEYLDRDGKTVPW
ncbi:SDR family NAD(P)-dependent oxidoreductase [Luteibacter sp. SG786]|uniref:SDR family NAD(P)-dependent oxidoreductase n=1 Tax=Luteibacter sp. SG786 TaxID=2587130 RepID=UPI00141E334A|nr:SDR family NAD(P)-dependent oxidoreductase [Luteibacter sp. SG786]NII53998.1 NAD(P)-dependent dehydrogenase (short-subunit alcohol dehydrogenase family) [Luteibacter sp. SG786]